MLLCLCLRKFPAFFLQRHSIGICWLEDPGELSGALLTDRSVSSPVTPWSHGCDYGHRQLTMLMSGVMLTIATLILCCWAMGKPPETSQKFCCLTCFPCFLLMIGAWVAFGLLSAAQNCETLRSMNPDSCEWSEPPPAAFEHDLCCVDWPPQ